MLPISANETVRFTPASYNDATEAPVYLLALPTVRMKAGLWREITAEGLSYPSDLDLYAAAREGIQTVVADDQREC